ncbi:leucine-rich repeat protein [Capnocytophaga sputigena]|uniref:leucine-rich repeat protein n=1 Tax=Capnocytophaga sputigena TaxID=1019 RepID=UPI0031F490D7
MFKKPFSFDGRIRRTEFGLSFIIFYIIFNFLDEVFNFNRSFSLIFLIPIFIFYFAQSAKRSHDIGESGWLSLIPLYNPFLLLFKEGNVGENVYGEDPKKRLNNTFFNNPSTTTPPPIIFSPVQATPSVHTEKKITQQYLLSEDGKTLLKWFDTQVTAIDMQADPILRNVTTIGRDAFYNCNKISKINFNGQLTTIQKAAFEDCEQLRHVSFPSRVSFIGEFLFGKNCIESISIESEIPPRLEGDFSYNDEKLQAIYVATSDISLYRNNENWKKYAYLIK